MVDLGISVVAANIRPEIVDRFWNSLENDSKAKISYDVIFIDQKDAIFTEYKGKKYYNRNKAHNIGVRYFLDTAKVILCADVDFLIGPNALDYTYKIGSRQPYSGIARFLMPGASIKPRKWDEWMKIKLHTAGYGGWNAMTPENWKKVGGWNESMFGWGFDRHMFDRITQAGLEPIRNGDIPLIHVAHGRRNKDIREIKPGLIDNLGFENYL